MVRRTIGSFVLHWLARAQLNFVARSHQRLREPATVLGMGLLCMAGTRLGA